MSRPGLLAAYSNGSVRGWVSAATGGPAEIEIRINEQPRYRGLASGPCEDATAPPGALGFQWSLPSGESVPSGSRIEVHRVDTGMPLAGSPLRVDVDLFEWDVTTFDDREIQGWIVNRSAPEDPPLVCLLVQGELVAVQSADQICEDGPHAGGAHGFRFEMPAADAYRPRQIALYVGTTGIDLLVGRAPLMSRALTVDVWTRVAHLLKAATLAGPDGVDARLTPDEFEYVMAQGPARGLALARGAMPATSAIPLAGKRPGAAPRAVTVIVPVYRDVEVTRACIESLLAARNHTPLALLLINDASPDAGMAAMLEAYAGSPGVRVIHQPRNRGFAATANAGIRACAADDVVLLNADTCVSDEWLDRLVAARDRDPLLASASPFSNCASIFGLFGFAADLPMPPGIDVAVAARWCAMWAGGQTVEVPTAHGFCMLIRRDAIEDVGEFDAETFGRGYGEENDFCMRASARGWRHMLVCDSFVEHRGSVSFAEEKDALLRENLERLSARYPEYHTRIRRFLAENPIRHVRGAIVRALLERDRRPTALLVTHSLEGGTEATVQALARVLDTRGYRSLVLRSGRTRHDPWTLGPPDNAMGIDYLPELDRERLLDDLRALNIVLVHNHHVIGYSFDVTTLADDLGVPGYYTLHDYFAVCPRVTLRDATGNYCGIPASVTVCERCISRAGVHGSAAESLESMGGSVAAWRERFATTLAAARGVFVPSEDTQARLQRVWPALATTVMPPILPSQMLTLRQRPADDTQTLHVAVIGGIGAHKGLAELRQLLIHVDTYGLPMHFTLFGHSANDAALMEAGPIAITGKFRRGELAPMLEASTAQVALVLSNWPETYGLVLDEALQAGLRPVAYDLGAPAVRMRNLRVGTLVPLGAPARNLAEAILSESQRVYPDVLPPLPAFDGATVLEQFYGLEAIGALPAAADSEVPQADVA